MLPIFYQPRKIYYLPTQVAFATTYKITNTIFRL